MCLWKSDLISKKDAKALPKTTEVQINRRRNLLIRLQSVKDAKKAVRKYYKNGIEAFDTKLLDKLYADENNAQTRILEVSAKIKEAKESKTYENMSEFRNELKTLKQTKSVIKQKIRVAEHQYSIYCRAVKPYIDSQRVIAQAESYRKFNEIEQNFTQE